MRRLFIISLSVAGFLCQACDPAGAEAPRPSAAAVASTKVRPLPVAIAYFQHPDFARVNILVGNLPTPEVRNVDGSVQVVLATGQPLRLSEYYTRAREVAGIESRVEDGKSFIIVRLTCDCDVKSARDGKIFSLLLHDAPKSTVKAPAKEPPANDQAKNEIKQLREELTAKLSQLNAPPPTPKPSAHAGGGTAAPAPAIAAAPPAPPPRPVCAPDFDLNTWKKEGRFTKALTALRHAAANSHEAPPEMEQLAEFYLSNGLAGEAREAALAALDTDTPIAETDRIRLRRDADIASLLRGDVIDAKSPLLADRTDCERTDLPLWRALAGAAGHDALAVARDVHAASRALGSVPEPLLQAFAFRLSDAAGDNIAALRDVADAVRNASLGTPEDEAARFLLQARIARSGGDTVDERAFLDRAAQHPATLPGLVARERLAELGLAGQGSTVSHDELMLADMARVYRGEHIGRDAAAALAEHHLRLGDYAGALTIADQSASPHGVRGADSRGAALAARILRVLLVDPPIPNLPEPSRRIALYLKYDGYGTPGRAGDDIRMGAARLMLDQGMASAALEVVHQLSAEVAATPQGKAIRALAEARAGDPSVALLLVRDLPESPATQRISADALEKMERPADAARQLDGLTGIADQTRRAELLFSAKAWGAAADAYATLLHEPTLSAEARKEAADRYGFALALSGTSPDRTLLPAKDALAERMISALPPSGGAAAAGGALSLPTMKAALERARRIETLLPPVSSGKGS